MKENKTGSNMKNIQRKETFTGLHNGSLGLTAHTWINISYAVGVIKKLEKVRQQCGQLCNTSRLATPGPYFNHTTANVNCDSLFGITYMESGHGLTKSPYLQTKQLRREFTMDDKIPLIDMYISEKYLNNDKHVLNWTKDLINKQTRLARKGALWGTYRYVVTNLVLEALNHTGNIYNGRVLVIGSEQPWVEASILSLGAREVVTLEYAKIKCTHPKIKTMVPAEFREYFLNRTLEPFDAVVTYSSVEHSGLGRYGDALNPWADIITIAQAWCVTKPRGTLTIGVPTGTDQLFFNAHRRYGQIRYPYLTTNWKQKYRSMLGDLDTVYVFQK